MNEVNLKIFDCGKYSETVNSIIASYWTSASKPLFYLFGRHRLLNADSAAVSSTVMWWLISEITGLVCCQRWRFSALWWINYTVATLSIKYQYHCYKAIIGFIYGFYFNSFLLIGHRFWFICKYFKLANKVTMYWSGFRVQLLNNELERGAGPDSRWTLPCLKRWFQKHA